MKQLYEKKKKQIRLHVCTSPLDASQILNYLITNVTLKFPVYRFYQYIHLVR